MSTSSEDEASIRSVSDEYSDDDDDSDTGSSDSSKRTLIETGNGPNRGATGIGYKRSDVPTPPSLSAPMDPDKRRILDDAVDAILNTKELMKHVRLKFKLTYAELDQALLEKGAVDIVKVSRSNRRKSRPDIIELLRKAVKDVTSNGMTMTASARLHKIDRKTLTRELIDQGLQFPRPRDDTALEAAVRDVINQKSTLATARSIHKVGHALMQKRLQALGYVLEGSRRKGKWIKARSGSEGKPGETAARTHKTPEKEDRNKLTEEESIDQSPPSTVESDGVNADEKASDSTQEIEKIVDVRTTRQYLVRWQGETEEEATWVDEDVFFGRTKLISTEQD